MTIGGPSCAAIFDPLFYSLLPAILLSSPLFLHRQVSSADGLPTDHHVRGGVGSTTEVMEVAPGGLLLVVVSHKHKCGRESIKYSQPIQTWDAKYNMIHVLSLWIYISFNFLMETSSHH